MDKKEYEAPKMEIIEMPFGGILCSSPGGGDGGVGGGETDCPKGADDCPDWLD